MKFLPDGRLALWAAITDLLTPEQRAKLRDTVWERRRWGPCLAHPGAVPVNGCVDGIACETCCPLGAVNAVTDARSWGFVPRPVTSFSTTARLVVEQAMEQTGISQQEIIDVADNEGGAYEDVDLNVAFAVLEPANQ